MLNQTWLPSLFLLHVSCSLTVAAFCSCRFQKPPGSVLHLEISTIH